MQDLFVWIVLLPIIAIYAAFIAAMFIRVYAPLLFSDILLSLHIAASRRKTEKFFKNRASNAAKKLYAECEKNGIKIGFGIVGAKYAGIAFWTKRKWYIFLDNSYLSQDTNGLLEISLAHEISHCLIIREPPAEFCAQKKIICELLREKWAWEAALELFKKLGITIDEKEFWNRARAAFATHIYGFMPKSCDAILKLNCPRMMEFFPSPLFRETSEEEIKKYLLEIPEKNIIKKSD